MTKRRLLLTLIVSTQLTYSQWFWQNYPIASKLWEKGTALKETIKARTAEFIKNNPKMSLAIAATAAVGSVFTFRSRIRGWINKNNKTNKQDLKTKKEDLKKRKKIVKKEKLANRSLSTSEI